MTRSVIFISSVQKELTPDSLRVPHRSITRNHRVCEALFLAGYIEKYGTGTLMMIRESMEHALPEPVFKQSGGEFVATIGRDWLTEEVMSKSGLNERQRRAVVYAQSHGQITNAVYRSIVGVIRKTAARDLEELVSKGVFRQVGATGRGAHYVISEKRDINVTNGTQTWTATKRDINGTNGTLAGGGIGSQMAHRKSGTGAGQRKSRSEPCRSPATAQVTTQVTTQVGTKSGPSRDQVAVLRKCLAESEIGDLMAVAGRSNRTKFRDQVLNPMLESGLIEMTIPDKPTSRLQKYRLTEKGRAWLRKGRP